MEEGNQIKKVRVACVERVSTTSQKEKQTIQAQTMLMREHCEKMGYEIYGWYKDDGWSGGLSLRPETERLLNDARNGCFDVAVCMSVDRMSRDSKYYWDVVATIRSLGIRVEYVQYPNLTEDDVLMENVLVGVAADERKRIAARLKNGKRVKMVVRKQFVGYRPPYGFMFVRYKNDPHDPGHLEFVDAKKKIAETVFRWVGHEGISANECIRRLAEMKIPSPRGYPRWTKATFLAMLKNESYLGRFWYYRHEPTVPKKYRKPEMIFRKNPKTGHKMRPRDEWVLIELPEMRVIDDETFQLVQDALKRNRRFSKRNTKRQTLLGGGLIMCEACGGTYYAGSIHGRDIYKCGDKLRRFPFPQTCPAEIKSVSAPRIETAVWRLANKVLKNPEFLIAQLEANRDMMQRKKTQTLRDLGLVESQMAEKDTEEKRLVLAVQKGTLRSEQIAEASKQLNLDRAYLIGQKKALQEKLREVEVSEGARNDIKQFCARASTELDDLTFEEKQSLIRLIVKKIYCNGRKIRIQFQLPIGGDNENGPEILVSPIKPAQTANFSNIANNRLPSTLLPRM